MDRRRQRDEAVCTPTKQSLSVVLARSHPTLTTSRSQLQYYTKQRQGRETSPSMGRLTSKHLNYLGTERIFPEQAPESVFLFRQTNTINHGPVF